MRYARLYSVHSHRCIYVDHFNIPTASKHMPPSRHEKKKIIRNRRRSDDYFSVRNARDTFEILCEFVWNSIPYILQSPFIQRFISLMGENRNYCEQYFADTLPRLPNRFIIWISWGIRRIHTVTSQIKSQIGSIIKTDWPCNDYLFVVSSSFARALMCWEGSIWMNIICLALESGEKWIQKKPNTYTNRYDHRT